MTENELLLLAEKVGNGTATKEEELLFYKEYEKFLKQLNDSLEVDIITNNLKN